MQAAEAHLFQRAREGDALAREALVRRYLPLARKLALRFSGRREPVDDLVQVASVGLVMAIDRFDPARGLAFSTFAVPTILGEVRRHFRDRTWSVHVPRELQERHLKLSAAVSTLNAQLGRQPTARELADHLDTTEEWVVEGLQVAYAQQTSSLDRPAGSGDEGESETVGNLIGGPEDGFEAVELWATLDAASQCLTHRQRRVLRLQLTEDLTQGEIADRVGISQMQVSRDLKVARTELRSTFA